MGCDKSAACWSSGCIVIRNGCCERNHYYPLNKTSFNKFNKFAFKIYNCVLISLSLAKRYCLSKSIIMIARHSVFMGSEGNIYEAFTLCWGGGARSGLTPPRARPGQPGQPATQTGARTHKLSDKSHSGLLMQNLPLSTDKALMRRS